MTGLDLSGVPVEKGDFVGFIIPRYHRMAIGRIIRITSCGVTVCYHDGNKMDHTSREYFLKISDDQVAAFLDTHPLLRELKEFHV